MNNLFLSQWNSCDPLRLCCTILIPSTPNHILPLWTWEHNLKGNMLNPRLKCSLDLDEPAEEKHHNSKTVSTQSRILLFLFNKYLYTLSLCSRPYFKGFIIINSFNPHYNPRRCLLPNVDSESPSGRVSWVPYVEGLAHLSVLSQQIEWWWPIMTRK